ncbi:MAG TPA: hypothetical protein PK662_09420 [Bacteroidales bacterium]|nr:hypothetical protein [Bacteroidales bacterium]
MDFTLTAYKNLLTTLQSAGYAFYTFEHYLSIPKHAEKFVILRHDVDEYSGNALKMAKIEHTLGIKSTYYFRIIKQSNNPEIIKQIAAMKHEIGYHYEDLAMAEGDYEKAIKSFQLNLAYFRNYYPIKTVCMHGSATSKHDNRLLWSTYKLEDFDLWGEPYLSLDFKKIFYLSDTGYAWDGGKFAVRDVVENSFGISYHSTQEIIQSIEKGKLPSQVMILAHTLWTNNYFQWIVLHLREFIRNNFKRMARNNAFLMRIYAILVKIYWKK